MLIFRNNSALFSAFLGFVFLTIFILPLQVHSQVKGKLIVTNIEAGGNGAAYGQSFIVGPSNRLSSLACPRPDLGSTPDGRIQCVTTYGSTDKTEWQPGDVLTARVPRSVGVTIPVASRPTTNISNCSTAFKGFSGVCQGMGTYNPSLGSGVYECTITLPSSGDVSLGVQFEGQTSLGDACPALTNPATPVPTTRATATPSGTALPGNKLYDALSKATDELAENLKITGALRGVAKIIIPKTADFTYDISVSVTTSATSSFSRNTKRILQQNFVRSYLLHKHLVLPARSTTIASASGQSSKSKRVTLRLSPTVAGKKILKKNSSVDVVITTVAKKDGKVKARVTVTKTIS